jgi:hypothetical protein
MRIVFVAQISSSKANKIEVDMFLIFLASSASWCGSGLDGRSITKPPQGCGDRPASHDPHLLGRLAADQCDFPHCTLFRPCYNH